MTHRGLILPVLGIAAALCAACSSQPTRFYTLVPAAAPDATTARAAFLIDVQDVRVPEQVDMPQLVLRQSDGEVAVVESRQWIAPLPAEIRDSLAGNLARRLGTIDVHTHVAGARSLPVYRVRLDVTRFESVLGREARLEATWTLGRSRQDGPLLSCPGVFVRPAGAEYDALVAAHQAALDGLSAQIAAAIAAAAADQPAVCPS